ncbi:MAG TPA: divalent metal cation transporter, partial [Chitinophagaceae bacterium]
NPAASVFHSAAGEIGYRIFGLVLWCAAITSVVGSAYTSVTFLRSVHPIFEKYQRISITIFIIVSTIIFAAIQQPPASILVIVGTLNGFILPIGLALMLLAVHNQSLMRGYKHPVWLQVIGWIVVIVMTWMVIKTLMAF